MRKVVAFALTVLLTSVTFAQPQRSRFVPVLVGFHDAPGVQEVAAVESYGGEVTRRFTLINAVAARLPLDAVEQLRQHPRVAIVEPDGIVFAVDAELDNTWGVKRIGAGTVHDGGNRGTGIKVAIIDTGVDYTHPELAPRYQGGIDCVNNDSDPIDDHGHGTHVAGTVLATDDEVGVVGVAPEAELYGVKVLNFAGSGLYSQVICGVEWAVANGMQVTNNSYGGGTFSALLEAAFAAAKNAGVISVAAAGNSGCCNTVLYPAKFNTTIAVAATDSADNRAGFSSAGPEVNVAAPGVAVLSSLLHGGYGLKSGTSMASPHAAGTVALMLAAGFQSDSVQGVLEATALDLGDPGRDDLYGWGLINAALAAAPGIRVDIESPDDEARFGEGTLITFEGLALDGSADISDEISWTSSVDGLFGSGRSVTFAPSVGRHVVTADARGISDSIGITVLIDTDPAPRVKIVSPAPDSRFVDGDFVRFIGQASDDIDGNLDPFIRWTSDKLGLIGQAREVTVKLPLGTNLMRADVTDKDGNTATDSIVVFVDPPAPPAPLTIEAITYKTFPKLGPWTHLDVEIQFSEKAQGIIAIADLRANGGSYLTVGGKSNGQGLVKITLLRIMPGCYVTTVLDVVGGTQPWDGKTPENGQCTSR